MRATPLGDFAKYWGSLLAVATTLGCATVGPRSLNHPIARELDAADFFYTSDIENRFSPPLKRIRVTSAFGKRARGWSLNDHTGVDLLAPHGTPVFASEAGLVVYASNHIQGYGNAVILKHAHGFASVYAHLARIAVKVGGRIKKGSRIAWSGATGAVTGPHLHFELWEGLQPVDPVPRLDMTDGPR